MKIEEAILYCLASQNRGMQTEQIAEMINRQKLHISKDGQPVTFNQVYAIIRRYLYKDLIDKELPDQMCHPIVVMSINTLIRYHNIFSRFGFHKIFDNYYTILR